MTLPSGRAAVPAGPPHLIMVRCGCCQKARTDPGEIALFGTLTDASGKTWRICGKCIQVMWHRRAPRPDKM